MICRGDKRDRRSIFEICLDSAYYHCCFAVQSVVYAGQLFYNTQIIRHYCILYDRVLFHVKCRACYRGKMY